MIKQSPQKLDFGFKSRLRVGKVLVTYCVHPKVIPIIKFAKRCVCFKIFIFLKNKKLFTKNIF